MKKFLSIVLACLLWVSCGAFLTGCGKVTVKDMRLVSGVSTRVLQHGTFSPANAVVAVTYSNKKTENLSAGNFTFSEIDTDVLGKQDLKATYTYNDKDYTFTIAKIEIVATDSELYTIGALYSQVWSDYTANKKPKADFHIDFYDHDEPLTVGADNYLDLGIFADAYDDEDKLVSGVVNIRTELTVQEKQGDGAYHPIDYSSILTKDTLTNCITFKDGAAGKELALTFKAATSDGAYEDPETQFTAYITVSEGFNIYDAQDLSLFDSMPWQAATRTAVRQKYGLANDYVPSKMFLLSSINLKKEDLPSHYFFEKHEDGDELYGTTDLDTWAADLDTFVEQNYPNDERTSIVGSMINYYGTGLYHRIMKSGEELEFNGNYFRLDVSLFPKAVVQKSDSSVTDKEQFATYNHALKEGPFQSLFFIGNCGINGADPVATPLTSETSAAFKNTAFYGNGEITSDMRNSGGLMMLKDRNINFTGTNTVANNFAIGYFFEQGYTNEYDGEFVVERCKGYGSFQDHFYSNDGEHIVIRDSYFEKAGGPGIIADHDEGRDGENGDPEGLKAPHIDIVNTEISSLVNTNSPWFKSYDLAITLMTVITSSCDHAFDGALASTHGLAASNKTLINKQPEGDMIDLVAIMKKNGSSLNGKIRGAIRVFETEEQYNAYYEDGIINTHGLDFDKDTSAHQMTYQGHEIDFTTYVTGAGSDMIMQSTNGGYINVGGLSNPGLLQTSLTAGVDRANTINAILNAAAQTSTQFTGMANLDVASRANNLLERFEAYYGGDDAKLDTFHNQQGAAALLGDGWEGMTAQAKLEAIRNLIMSVKNNYEYATGNYINIYIYNGMGAMVRLYDKAA